MTSAWLESFGDVDRYNFLLHGKFDGRICAHRLGVRQVRTRQRPVTDLKGQRAMAYYTDDAYDGSRPELKTMTTGWLRNLRCPFLLARS